MDRRTFVKAAAASAAAVAFSRVATPPATAAAVGSVTTNDGINLRYEEAGSGKPLVCIPGLVADRRPVQASTERAQ